MQTTYRMLILAFTVLFASLPVAANAAGFTISANGEADNAMLPAAMGYDKTDSSGVRLCGGVNRAPGFSWANAPAKTVSYAILEVDPDGRGGLGVNHWVIYNIPGSASGISAAEIAAGKYTPGRGTGDLVGYRGPCPPPGDAPHHYIVQLFALDAPPDFPAGLDHDGVVAAMKGHTLGATTTIMRFQRL
jgi:Raf kinase inhibitor-like YbhB/YbcL family protein